MNKSLHAGVTRLIWFLIYGLCLKRDEIEDGPHNLVSEMTSAEAESSRRDQSEILRGIDK